MAGMNRPLICLVVWSGVLLLANCSKSKPAPPSIVPTVALANSFQPQDREPFGAFFMANNPLHSCLYAELFRLDEHLQPHTFLIEKYQQKGKDVWFTLKANLRFSDGSPITSADVIWSITQSIRNRELRNIIHKWMVDGDAILAGDNEHQRGMTIIDDQNFVLHFAYENNLYPFFLATHSVPIVGKRQYQKGVIVFSGPYTLERTEPTTNRTRVFLRRNPHYSGSPAKCDQLCFHFFNTQEAFAASVGRGETDMFLNFMIPLSSVHETYQIIRFPILGGFYLMLNPDRGILKDRDFRHYLKQAANPALFLDEAWRTLYSPATHVLPYGLEEYFLFKPGPFDSRLPAPMKSPVTVNALSLDTGIRPTFGHFLQEQLAKFNISLKIETVARRDYWNRIRDNQFELTFLYYLMDTPLAHYFYDMVFSPGMELHSGAPNQTAIDLLAAFQTTTQPLERLQILSQLEMIAWQEARLIPIYNLLAIMGHKRSVSSLRSSHLLLIPMEEISVVERD